MRRLLQVSLIFVLLIVTKGFAQDSVTTRVFDKDFFLYEKGIKQNDGVRDSSFNHIQNYFSRNLMGNIGLPDYEYLLSYKEDPIGVRWFNSPYNSKLLGLTEQYQYGGKGLSTNIFGAAGTMKEQVLKLSHSQNINENCNVSVKLNRYAADGFYQRQQSFVNNVFVASNYTTKKKRLGILFSYGFDRFKHLENGGITSDTSIVKDLLVDKRLIPVNLLSARRNYSLMTGSLRFFFKLNMDSLSKVNHYVLLGGNGSINKSHYTDIPSAFYDSTTFINEFSTNDTTKFSKVSPDLSYNLTSKNINFEIGAKYEFSEWYTPDSLHRYTSVIGFQRFAWQSNSGAFKIKEKLSYIASGSNAGDYTASIHASLYTPVLKTTFSLLAITELRSPDLFFNYNRVNNFYWKNAFEKTSTNSGSFFIDSKKLQLTLGTVYRNVNKLIVLDSMAAPKQLQKNAVTARIFLKHHLKLFKFHLENQINYQSTNAYALPVPYLYTQHQLYFEHRVKKNGLRMQIGVQANYIDKMDLISYNPALNSYYLKKSKEQGGGYVFADFFFNVHFKPVTFFFKAEHLNQGFTGMNYTLLNGYFQPDRAFRFGLNWEFWD